MNDDQLINKKFHILQRNKISYRSERFIYKEISNRINDSLEGVNFLSDKSLEIGYTSDNTYEYLMKRFKNTNYSVLDISKKLLINLPKKINSHCFDHDEWKIKNNQFNFIISNLYLHFSNDLEELLKNINISLKDNGFFIATIPGLNFLKELKKVMIYTDIEIYNGAYRRFFENFTISNISNILKKNNFKNTLIEIDTLNIKYNSFSKLLNDIKNLGSSYMHYDRKKTFEKKIYFKKVEEIYWKKYSKNNKLNLTLEIIIFSGWK